jgi:hypothetical protein
VVSVGVDGHGSNSELPAGARHPHRDLTSVGYQDLVQHTDLEALDICQLEKSARLEECSSTMSLAAA